MTYRLYFHKPRCTLSVVGDLDTVQLTRHAILAADWVECSWLTFWVLRAWNRLRYRGQVAQEWEV